MDLHIDGGTGASCKPGDSSRGGHARNTVQLPAPPVPTYKLFGENDPWQSPDLVHCETIAERSALHNWEIAPHRHDNLAQIVFLHQGHARITIETKRDSVQTPCLIFLPPRQIHGFFFSDDVTGFILTIPHSLLNELVAMTPNLHGQLNHFRLFQLQEQGIELAAIDTLFAHFVAEYSGDEAGRASMLMAYLTQMAVWLVRLGKARDAGVAPPERGDGDRHISRFQDLIEAHFADWKPLAFYADRLGISPRQLNACCRRATGQSAQNLIHDRLLLEARRLLAYSDASVTSISYTLGFSEPGYFSRFFSRSLKVSPSEFRQRAASQGAGARTH